MQIKGLAKSFKEKQQERSIVSWVMDRYKSAYDMKDMLGVRQNVKLFHEYWAGENDPSEGGSSKTNIIQAIIESQVADLTQEDIDVEVFGVEISDMPFAQDVGMVCDWVWDKNKMVPKIDGAERERLVQGSVGWKVYYDEEALRGRGLITIDYCGIETMFPDPKITDPFKIQEGDFFIHTQVRPLSFFRRIFGERGKKVKAEIAMQYYDYRVLEETAIADDIVGDEAVLYEYWWKDDDLNLRLIYCTQDELLYDSRWDTEESYLEHGKYPFVIIPCYKCKGKLWGKGDVEQLIPVQNTIDDLDDQIMANARLTANNQIVVSTGCGINLKTWTNEPGLKVPCNGDINGWKQVVPYPMPMYVISRREKAFEEAELVSGRPDVLEGRRAGSLRAASAIIALQEAGQRRGNHKALMLSEGLGQVMELVVDTMKEFMTTDMVFKVTNKDKVEYKWFKGSSLKEVPELIPRNISKTKLTDEQLANPIIDQASGQELVPLTDDKGKVIHKEAFFDLKIKIGSGMPHNKSFMYQAVLELFREGIITQEEARFVLKEIISWPMIDPFNPVGTFGGRNLSPDLANMLNGQNGEQGSPTGIPSIDQLLQTAMQGQMTPQQPQFPGQLPPDLAGMVNGTAVPGM